MLNQNEKKVTIAKDTLIYMIAKIIEGLVGVLTISAMSYIYNPNQIGVYSTVNIAVTTVAMVSIQWLVQSVLRYISKYQAENKNKQFFTTTFLAWLKVNLIILLTGFFSLTLIYISSIKKLAFFENYPIMTLTLALLMFFSYNTYQLVIALLAGVRLAKVNLYLSILNVTGKLVLIIAFNKLFLININFVFISYIVLDLLTSIIGVKKLNIFKYIDFKSNCPQILSTLKVYGLPLMGNMIATSILNKSDIYIITSFLGNFSSGIYQTNYSIIASAFTLLSAGAMRGSYPTILKVWNEGDKELACNLISAAVRIFLIIAVPAVFGIFSLSDFIAASLFEESYFTGHRIMGFVALGMLFLGLTEYAIKPWELNARTREIFKRSLFCGILNILLNIMLVPYFSYEVCAINTFISFILYFMLAKVGTRNQIKWNLNFLVYFRIIFCSFLMFLSIIYFKRFFNINLFSLLILVILGVLVYFVSLFLTGEIKKEVKSLIYKLKYKYK